jgi:hypothetical protein
MSIQPGRSLWLLLGHASGMPHFIDILSFNATAFLLLLFNLALVCYPAPQLTRVGNGTDPPPRQAN